MNKEKLERLVADTSIVVANKIKHTGKLPASGSAVFYRGDEGVDIISVEICPDNEVTQAASAIDLKKVVASVGENIEGVVTILDCWFYSQGKPDEKKSAVYILGETPDFDCQVLVEWTEKDGDYEVSITRPSFNFIGGEIKVFKRAH